MDELIVVDRGLTAQQVGKIANERAAQHVFEDYRAKLAPSTVKQHQLRIRLLEDYLTYTGHGGQAVELLDSPEAWKDMTWGLVRGFGRWMLKHGYAVGTVNGALDTVRKHCRLAWQSGFIEDREWLLIKSVEGYGRAKTADNINEHRLEAGTPIRREGSKKAETTIIDDEQARLLKNQHPDTPLGRRDRLLMCLLLDLGIRASEVSGISVEDIDLKYRRIRVYRKKVGKRQVLKMTEAIYQALVPYLENDAFESGPLLRNGHKGGTLTTPGMSPIRLTERVRTLGRRILGIDRLSAHDCRHYWTTTAFNHETPIDVVTEAGGWSGPEMPMKYKNASFIANKGVRLADEHIT